MEKLEHIADVEKFSSFSINLVKDDLELGERVRATINTRTAICKSCGNLMFLFDEFSRISEAVGKNTSTETSKSG